MAPKGKGENTKKAAGNAKKAEAAASKQAQQEAQAEADESEKWAKGAKGNAKKEAAADKAAEAARKKAEKAALEAEEEASLPKTQKPNKSAAKKTGPSKGTLDLGKLDALNATGIDDALDALSLANSSGANDKIDRHPERRKKAAYAAFEERRLGEMADEKGLRRQQKIDQIRKEFEKSPENPMNQANAGRFDLSKEEMAEMRADERERIENRLAGK